MEWFLDAGIDEQRALETFEGDNETFMEICSVVNPGNDPGDRIINRLIEVRCMAIEYLAELDHRMNYRIPNDVMEWFLDAGIDQQRAVESFDGDLETFMEICAVINPGNDPEDKYDFEFYNDRLKYVRRMVKNRVAAKQSRMNQNNFYFEQIANLQNIQRWYQVKHDMKLMQI